MATNAGEVSAGENPSTPCGESNQGLASVCVPFRRGRANGRRRCSTRGAAAGGASADEPVAFVSATKWQGSATRRGSPASSGSHSTSTEFQLVNLARPVPGGAMRFLSQRRASITSGRTSSWPGWRTSKSLRRISRDDRWDSEFFVGVRLAPAASAWRPGLTRACRPSSAKEVQILRGCCERCSRNARQN